MRVGLAQLECSVGDVETNCGKIEEFCRRAADGECDVIVFPEMSDTGYVPEVHNYKSFLLGRPSI